MKKGYVPNEVNTAFIEANKKLIEKIYSSNWNIMHKNQLTILIHAFMRSEYWNGGLEEEKFPLAVKTLFKQAGLKEELSRANWIPDELWIYLAKYIGGVAFNTRRTIHAWGRFAFLLNNSFVKEIKRLGSIEKMISFVSLFGPLFNKGQMLISHSPRILEQDFQLSINYFGAENFINKHMYFGQGMGVSGYCKYLVTLVDPEHKPLIFKHLVNAVDILDQFSDKNVEYSAYAYLKRSAAYRIVPDYHKEKKIEFLLDGIIYGKEISLAPCKIINEEKINILTDIPKHLNDLFSKLTKSTNRTTMLESSAGTEKIEDLLADRSIVFLPENYRSHNFKYIPQKCSLRIPGLLLIRPILDNAGNILFEKGETFYLHYKIIEGQIKRNIFPDPRNIFEIDLQGIKSSMDFYRKESKDALIAIDLLKNELELFTNPAINPRYINKSIDRVVQLINNQIKIQDAYTVAHSHGVASIYSNMMLVANNLKEEILDPREMDIMAQNQIDYDYNPGKPVDPLLLNWAWLAAFTHDIGKKEIFSPILKKEGPLTDTEFTEIKKHPVFSAKILSSLGLDFLLLLNVYHHISITHESGYPVKIETTDGIVTLKGEKILKQHIGLPTYAMAIADFIHTRQGRPYSGNRCSPPSFMRAEVKRCSGLEMNEWDWASITAERILELQARARGIPQEDFNYTLKRLTETYTNHNFLIATDILYEDMNRLFNLLEGIQMEAAGISPRNNINICYYKDYFSKLWQSWYSRPLLYDPRSAKLYILNQNIIHSPIIKSSKIYGLPGGKKLYLPKKSMFIY